MNTNFPYKKIFISHASKDREFGDILVKLLRGIGMTRQQIIYTSDPQYGIPIDENIFTYLKNQINEDAYMLYMLSDNYYKSIACMNEMGAAWVWQNAYTMLMLPGFDADNPGLRKGVADQNKIAVPLDNPVRMKEFVNRIIAAFGLDIADQDVEDACERYFQDLEEIKKIRRIDYTIELAGVERELRRTSQKSELYHRKGWLLYDIDTQNYPEAVQNLLYSIYLDPNYSEAYYRLVQVAGVYGDASRALAVAEEACRRFPQNADSYGCRAFAYHCNRQEDRAIEDADKAISMKPTGWFYLTRGISYFIKGDENAALSDCWASYNMDHGYTDAIGWIRKISRQIGTESMLKTAEGLKKQASEEKTKQKIDESRKYFECVLLTEPDNLEARRELGGLYYDVEQWGKALEQWVRLLELEESDYYYWLCGLACKRIGKVKEKFEFVRKGLECQDTGYHKELRAL